ncbi:hypothetical protein GCM10010344_49750 [Streptomyces bluensis]|nr:hypothetical protein GCM10010344_49750 [Streptomyces bluensis]
MGAITIRFGMVRPFRARGRERTCAAREADSGAVTVTWRAPQAEGIVPEGKPDGMCVCIDCLLRINRPAGHGIPVPAAPLCDPGHARGRHPWK